MKNLYLMTLICLVFYSSLMGNNEIVILEYPIINMAQDFLVKGKVVDETGAPLPGATVVEDGTANGVSTDFDGNFEIAVKNINSILAISYLGYETQRLSAKSESLEVRLQPDAGLLDEVVVTALGISRKSKSLTYATQKVVPEELTQIRDPNNLLNTFQGKIANAVITQSSGGVGSDARVVLRGNSSIDGSNGALIVVDGVPNSLASNINPDDIESINILPGASAAALYGSQAGNGVIVITTKKGKAGKVSVSVNSGVTLETPFALPRVQNTYGQGNGGVLDIATGNSWGAMMSGQEYTNYLGESSIYSPQRNNIRDFFSTGVNIFNSIGITGGAEKTQTYLSYTSNEVEGIIPNNELSSHNINLRVSNQISEKLSVDAKVTYFTRKIDNRPRSGEGNTPVLDIYQIPRNVSTLEAQQYQVTSDLGTPQRAPWPSTVQSVYGNPYWAVNNDIHNIKQDQVVGFLSAKYDINNWLSVTGRANLDRSFVKEDRSVYEGTLSWARNPGGYYSESNITSTQKWFDLIFQGKNKLSENFKVDYNIGAIYQDNEFEQSNSIANGLNVANKFSLNFASNPQIASSGSQVQTQSVFGQVNLSYKDALFLDGSLRNDWDSRLPKPHSFEYYSLGGTAILTDLFTLPKKLSYLKLNVSYAEVGNGGQFGLLSTTYSYGQGVGNGYLSRSPILPLPGLKPEIVKSKEVGMEARFFNNRAGFALTYYRSNSSNQLLTISLPSGTGYSSQYINAGNVQNSGVELVLDASPIKNEDFEWNVNFNLAMNRNKVVELSDDLEVVYLGGFLDFGGRPQIKVGGSYGDLVSYQWLRDDNGNYRVTDAGTPLTTNVVGAQPEVIGNFNPDATLGLSNSFSYKGFSIRALIDGRIGGEIISGTEMNLANSGIPEGTLPYREGGWNLGGVNADGQVVNESISAQEFWQRASYKRFGIGEFFAYDATNFRLREVSLGYRVPLLPSFIKSLDISLVGRNLFWIYRGKSILDIPGVENRKLWFDPDVSMGSGNQFQGIEYGAFPSTRSYGVNLKFTF